MGSLFAAAVSLTLPDWLTSLDWSHLIAAGLPIAVVILSAQFPQLAPVLALLKLIPKPAPSPSPAPAPVIPTPGPTPAPVMPNHPILDGLLQLLLAQLMKKNGTTDPVSAVVKELGSIDPPGK
jgi:hypothetical protein